MSVDYFFFVYCTTKRNQISHPINLLSDKDIASKVAVVSYSRYCRYRAVLKRLESVEEEWIRNKLIETLTGFVATNPSMKIMFCRVSLDEFPGDLDHETLLLLSGHI